MKRYIRSAETYESEYNYRFAGKRPGEKLQVSILGEVFDGLTVFVVEFSDGTTRYRVGEAPGDNANVYTSFSWELSKIGVSVDKYDSDEDIFSKVEDTFFKFLRRPEIQALIPYGDPAELHWHIFENLVWIYDESKLSSKGEALKLYQGYMYQDSLHLEPTVDYLVYLMQSGVEFDANFKKYFAPRIDSAEMELRDIAKLEKRKATPYPYDADDAVAEAVHELFTFIKEGLKISDDPESLREYIETKSVNNKRSLRYNKPEVRQNIEDLFAWIDENNLFGSTLKSACNKIYNLYLDKKDLHLDWRPSFRR